jgi:hypothetical protein
MSEAIATNWSPSPGNKNFGKLKLEVARYILMPDDPEALDLAGDGITDALRFVNTMEWSWTLATDDITLVADTQDYQGPADFHKPRAAVFLDSNDKPNSNPGEVSRPEVLSGRSGLTGFC